MRFELSKIDYEMENMSELNIELSKLVYHVKKFYNACILKNEIKRNVYKLAEAKSHLLSCLTIIKNKIESENNDLINEFRMQISVMPKDIDDYFENFLSSLDSQQKQLIRDIQNSEDNIISGLTVNASIKNFMEELKDGMENIILYPLTMSIRIYTMNNFDERFKDVPKRKIFKFILFRCVLNSAKIKGSEKRQKVAVSSSTIGTTFQEHNVFKQGRVHQKQPVQQEQESVEETDDFEDIFTEEF